MSTDVGTSGRTREDGVSLGGLRFAVFSTRNMIFLTAVLAMNYTLMRPSPVDLLFILSMVMTLFLITLYQKQQVTKRAIIMTLLVGGWAVSFFVASMPHLEEQFVPFELLAKTFAISIAITGAFVSMTWSRRNFETFMWFYIAACVIGAILGTIGFVLQHELLTWDGRAKGLIDDPNMYGSFLIPAVIFCTYFLTRNQGSKLILSGALALITIGILLCLSRIAAVAALVCVFAYVIFHFRRQPTRLILMAGGLGVVGIVLVGLASLMSPEFSERFLERLTLAQPYDLGEQGRYGRYLLVLPMIMQDPIGVGVLQLEKIFPEPIHNIWLSSFVNYGWGGGASWVTLAIGSVVVSVRNYRRTRSEISVVLLLSLIGIVMCASLHEGEHWRQMWLMFGLVWGFNTFNFVPATERRPAKRPAPPLPVQDRAPLPSKYRSANSAVPTAKLGI